MNITIILWFIFLSVILLGYYYFEESSGKEIVKSHLEQKGFQHIKIRTRLFAGGRGTLVFDIEYLNKHSVLQKNSCTVHTSIFSDGKIYWVKPLR